MADAVSISFVAASEFVSQKELLRDLTGVAARLTSGEHREPNPAHWMNVRLRLTTV
jgi:hypothetical protein